MVRPVRIAVAEVVRGTTAPLCSGRDGLRSFRVMEAVLESATTGLPVDIPTDPEQELPT